MYVDNFFIFSNDDAKTLKKKLNKNFNVKDLGGIKECLGMVIDYNKEEKSITLS